MDIYQIYINLSPQLEESVDQYFHEKEAIWPRNQSIVATPRVPSKAAARPATAATRAALRPTPRPTPARATPKPTAGARGGRLIATSTWIQMPKSQRLERAGMKIFVSSHSDNLSIELEHRVFKKVALSYIYLIV
jgi:hypothetical protein